MAIWHLGILIVRSFEWIKCLERLDKNHGANFRCLRLLCLNEQLFKAYPVHSTII